LLLVILVSSFLVINNSAMQWAAGADGGEIKISDFDALFTSNSVRIIYPSEQTPKPLNCASAMGNDWVASAFISTKLENFTEGTDTDSAFVNQTTGKPLGAVGTGIISFGGPLVNSVVAYAESEATPTEDRAPVRFQQNEETCCFQFQNGTSVPEAALFLSSVNGSVDMFVIETYQDSDGRNVMLGYGLGWKGTYAAGKYFDAEVYQNLTAYPYSWVIVLWHESNGNGFVNNAADGDTYTVIATSENPGMQVSEDTDWSFRKSHVVTSAVGAGTDYPVKVVVNYGSGVDDGENVFLNANCRSDFGDVRFTSDDGATLLDYWMESKAYYDKAVFWVKIPGDLSSSNQTIYVYYGNSNATSTSNGTNTFLFFDDFTTYDTAKWTTKNGTPTVNNGIVTTNATEIWGNTEYSHPLRIKCRGKINEDKGYGQVMTLKNAADTEYIILCFRHLEFPLQRVETHINDGGMAQYTAINFAIGKYYNWEALWAASSVVFLKDGTTTATHTYKVPEESLFPRVLSSGDNPEVNVDWVFISKYVSPEPSHDAWGSEEPVAVTGL
jgi:hypothetical protein